MASTWPIGTGRWCADLWQERCEVSLSRSSCLNYLHRLGFVLKRPKKRLLKADAAKRETFVAEYAALVDEAQQVGAKVFCVDVVSRQ